MGFLDVIGRMIQGKPAFEVTPSESRDTTSDESDDQAGARSLVDHRGRKIIPQIEIEHVTSHRQNDSLTVTAWIKNHSATEIELDKIHILGTKLEIDRRLRPGQAYQVTLYKGKMLKHDHDHKTSLQYKIIENGDYFLAHYSIEFKRESDGMYTIKRLEDNNGVQDI